MMTPCEEFLAKRTRTAKRPRNAGQLDHEEIKAGTGDVEFSRRVSGKEIKNCKRDQGVRRDKELLIAGGNRGSQREQGERSGKEVAIVAI